MTWEFMVINSKFWKIPEFKFKVLLKNHIFRVEVNPYSKISKMYHYILWSASELTFSHFFQINYKFHLFFEFYQKIKTGRMNKKPESPKEFGQIQPYSHRFPARTKMSYLRDIRGNETRCQIGIGLCDWPISHGNWRTTVAGQTH